MRGALRIGLAGVTVAVGVTVVMVWLRPPPLTPPQPSLETLPPALAREVRRRSDAVTRAPEAAAAWGRLAMLYDVHDLVPEALACYEEAERCDPSDWRWPYFRGVVTAIGDRSAALAHFRRAAARAAPHPPLDVRIGRCELLDDRLDAAQASFERALAGDPSLKRAHIGLAKVALARQQFEVAVRHLGLALGLGADSSELHRLLAEACRRLGDDDRAALHGRRAHGKQAFEPLADPIRAALGLEHGVTLRWRRARSEHAIAAGRPEDAIAEWTSALQENPFEPELHRELGEIYLRLGRVADALRHLEESMALDPVPARTWLHLGNARASAGDRDGALAAFQEALDRDGNLHEARGNLGALLLAQGRTGDGLAQLRAAASGLPGNADVRINLALALIGAEQIPEAERVLEECLTIDPGRVRARFEYALLLARTGRFDGAAAELASVIALAPERLAAHTNRIRALLRSDRYEDAIAAHRLALEHHPGEVSLQQGLAWLLATIPEDRLRDGREACAIMERLTSDPGSRTVERLRILAAAHAELGDFGAAVTCISEALGVAGADEAGQLRELEELYRSERPLRLRRAGE